MPPPKKNKPRNRGTFEHIQMLALAAVENPNPDLDYFERRARRSFSTTFNVSLLDTDRLPIEVILQHLYEYKYENMTPNERIRAAVELLKTPEERQQEKDDELRRMDDDNMYLVEQNQKDKAQAAKAPDSSTIPDLSDRHIKFDE